ncbi:MAG: Rne/Rng family ribonuclease, partial [Planctomycetes bacterium]|nr:Rne/Rng family ribonuclease [Planctomycetota bacterium]
MTKQKDTTKEMLINVVEGQECRIAVVSDAGLEELYVERTATASHVGNIYKGRITNVEPAIQAAFVDIGLGKNGFLHISDVNPTYFPKGRQVTEQVGRKRPFHVRPPIQECLRRGQEVVVQMTKEGIGTKGPTLTTYLSIPGRLLVMMPGMTRLGVSRKVEDEAVRHRARKILGELKIPPDIGFIVRTAGVDRAKRDLQRDLNYLLRLWKAAKQRINTARPPAEIYRESDLVTRTIRDVYNSDIRRIICDSEPVARRVAEFLRVAVPRGKHVVEVYTGKLGLFFEYGLEAEIEKIHARRVELPSGGSLVIDQVEALVAIDVNSGRYRQHSDAETTALKINLQAAGEIVRQLKLRDLGGVIVIDFIDMREERNRRALERTLREALKNDRAKTKVLRISAFGLVELTRQRLGPSLRQSLYDRCPHCDGMGMIQSSESLALTVMRNIQRACADENVSHVEAAVPEAIAYRLINYQRR